MFIHFETNIKWSSFLWFWSLSSLWSFGYVRILVAALPLNQRTVSGRFSRCSPSVYVALLNRWASVPRNATINQTGLVLRVSKRDGRLYKKTCL
jgi:hypothetical protein